MKIITNELENTLKKVTLTNNSIVSFESTNNGKIKITSMTYGETISREISLLTEDKIEAFTVDTEQLLKGLKYFKDAETDIENIGDYIIFKNANKKIEISPVETQIINMENVFKDEDTKEYTYNTKDLKYRLSKAILKGVHFSGRDIVSLDGYRLALNVDDTLNIEESFTLESKYCKNLIKLIDKQETNIIIKASNGFIQFEFDNYIYTAELMEGDYMNYSSVIPTDFETRLSLEYNEIKETIDFLNSLKNKGDRYNPLKIDLNDNVIFSIENKKNNSSVNIENYTKNGDDLTIYFNINYISDVIKNLDKDSRDIKFNFNNRISPLVVQENENTQYLVLPLRMQQ